MTDYQELMDILSTPRPNGSRGERETRQRLKSWLDQRGIPYRVQTFSHDPYFFEAIGLWLIVSRTLLALAIWLRWGWPALAIALVSLPGGLLDMALHLPCVSWMGRCKGENILIEFGPGGDGKAACQELLLTAHYDSKTELLDHVQRMIFLRGLPLGILLTLLLGALGPADRLLLATGSPWAQATYIACVLLCLPLLFLAWGLGLNLSLGRLVKPSQGAVDNGTACAILLGLAQRLQVAERRGAAPLQHTRLTLALFTGEEVNLQGSRAYVQSRLWPLPAVAVNMEAMAQDGDYVYWERDGSIFRLEPTAAGLNAALCDAVAQVAGRAPKPDGPVISDAASFLRAGIPAAVLGTHDTKWINRGFHRPSDCRERVVMERLPEGVEILSCLVQKYDRNEVKP